MNKKIEDKIKQDKIIQEIMPFLQGTQAHLVGGYIRDVFLNKETFFLFFSFLYIEELYP